MLIRPFLAGEEAYILQAHTVIYQSEYQFDHTFEEFIRSGLASFLQTFDADKENIWIIDEEGQRKGSIAISKQSDEIAHLRWFLIEPEARGQGYGRGLMEVAIQFCLDQQYERINLWTNSNLDRARDLYQQYGFQIIETREQVLSNQLIREECWEKRLK